MINKRTRNLLVEFPFSSKPVPMHEQIRVNAIPMPDSIPDSLCLLVNLCLFHNRFIDCYRLMKNGNPKTKKRTDREMMGWCEIDCERGGDVVTTVAVAKE